MNNDEDILAKAIAQLKEQQIPDDPPAALLQETLQRLAEAQSQVGGLKHTTDLNRARGQSGRTTFLRLAVRMTTAAAALVLVGYAIGRLSAPPPPDLDQLREALAPRLAVSLEPAIRATLMDDMKQRYELALANTYVHLKEELAQEYRANLDRFAAQMLAASNAVTNRLLARLVESLDVAQTQERRRVAAALDEIELNRRRDSAHLSEALVSFAARTEDEFQQTKLGLAQLSFCMQLENPVPGETANPNINKRKE